MVDSSVRVASVDSLSANEFLVEIDGQVADGIFGVSGLCVRYIDLEKQKIVQRPLIITKMVQRDPTKPFNQWTRETLANPTSKIARTLTIIAMDEKVETRRWVFKDAWISCIEFSDFDSSSGVLVEERLTIQHGGVEEVWPGQL